MPLLGTGSAAFSALTGESWCRYVHPPCQLLPASPSEPLLGAGEAALGLSCENLHKKLVSEEQLLTCGVNTKHPFFLESPCSYRCGSARSPPLLLFPVTTRATNVLCFRLTAATNSLEMLVVPREPQGSSWLQSALQALGWPAPSSPWVSISWTTSGLQSGWASWHAHPAQATGSLRPHELWHRPCSQESRRLLTSDLFGKLTIDCSPFPSPLTSKI